MPDPATLANRFGYGLRPGEAVAPPLRQFAAYDPRPAAFASAPTRTAVAGNLADYLEKTREVRQAMRAGNGAAAMTPAQPAMMDMPTMAGAAGDRTKAKDDPATRDALKETRRYAAQVARGEYLSLVAARANAALTGPAPFVERMVHFWANHFAISIDKLQVTGLGGLLEVEAVRPHVLGKFTDMLLAVERHPAMLLYLDQAQSIGPDSRAGTVAASRGRRALGLNENLAREIMELHTLGVRSGYAQADVTEFARALTGWTVAGIGRGPGARMAGTDGPPGDFIFAEALHQPGDRVVIGRRYPAAGERQGEAILRDLAAHPATAKHIATKLARHFAGDTPPPTLVARLEAGFVSSGGDLPTLYRLLVEAPELAGPQPLKYKSPWDWTIGALRALGTNEVKGQAIAGLQTQLGQQVWKPGSPAGYDDTDAAWAGPDALMRRVAAASRFAVQATTLDPRVLAAQILPAGGGAATRGAIARAETQGEGLALLLVSPELLRR